MFTFGGFVSVGAIIGTYAGSIVGLGFLGYLATYWYPWLKTDTEANRIRLIKYFKIVKIAYGVFAIICVIVTITGFANVYDNPKVNAYVTIYGSNYAISSCVNIWFYHYLVKVATRFSKQPIVNV